MSNEVAVDNPGRIAILALTPGGRDLAKRLETGLPGAFEADTGKGVAASLSSLWSEVNGFVCIMAAGIVVRTVASLLESKKSDPCIVCLDERGKYSLSLLSGHLGGGNDLALQVADLTGGQAVITTASDNLGLPALDLWCREQNLVPEDSGALTRLSAQLVNRGGISVCSEVPVESLPQGLYLASEAGRADLVISSRLDPPAEGEVFRPRNLVVGVGCNRGTPAREFEEALGELFAEAGLPVTGIRNLASIDLKGDEPGLLTFAARHGWRLALYGKEALNRIQGLAFSVAAFQAVGASGVAEPAALLSAHNDGRDKGELLEHLLIRKKKWRNLTMAVARADCILSAPAPDRENI